MELNLWFTLAILVTLAIGITSFINKIFVQKEYDTETVTFTFYLSFFFVSLISVIISQNLVFSKSIIMVGLIAAIADNLFYRTRLKSLKYLSTSNYFINVRIFSAVGLLFVGILFFNDSISINEYIGFFLGFIVLYLLIKDDMKNNKNLKKGMLFLILGILLVISGHSNVKYATSLNNAISFIFYMALFAVLISTVTFFKSKKVNLNIKTLKPIIILNAFQAILYFSYYFFLLKTYTLGDLAISFKIQSYSPFIPIILSAFIFKEDLSKNKILALFLAGISLWLFVM